MNEILKNDTAASRARAGVAAIIGLLFICGVSPACGEEEDGGAVKVCAPSDKRCAADNKAVEQCSDDGSGWETVDACEEKETCKEGECAVEEPFCTAGERKCAEGENAVLACLPDGSAWEKEKQCGEGETCEEGECAAVRVCTPGEKRCASEGEAVEECKADGTGWNAARECGAGEYCQQAECLSDHEREPNDAGGVNDTFQTAEPVPLGVDFKGHVGLDGDEDFFKFSVDEEGIVDISIDFTPSFNAMRIFTMIIASYTDDWLQSNTGVAGSNPERAECRDYGAAKWCPSSAEFHQSVTAIQGTYVLKVSGTGYPQMGGQGYDTQNPYVLHLDFRPGLTLESDQPDVEGVHVGEADIWKTAHRITFDGGDYGTGVIATYGYYWNDIDWFWFPTVADGWVRIMADVSPMEDNDPDVIVMSLNGGLFRKTPTGVESANLSFIVTDSPNCPIDRGETAAIKGNEKYYFRVYSFEYSETTPYKITVEYGAGGIEDDQPGDVGAVETVEEAYDIGALTSGQTAVASSYFWHHMDKDWYKVHTPAGGVGALDIIVDYSASYSQYGWWSDRLCTDHPEGIKVWIYLFDEAWFNGGRDFSEHLVRGTEDDVPSQQINWQASPDTDYYILVMSRENRDKENPYSVNATFTAQ